jgi:hypothetical protein
MGQVNVPTDLERGELLAEKVSKWFLSFSFPPF